LRNYEEVGKALHQTYNKVMENPLSDPESDQSIKDGKHLKKYKDLINPKLSEKNIYKKSEKSKEREDEIERFDKI
jgi:hypothetical protein